MTSKQFSWGVAVLLILDVIRWSVLVGFAEISLLADAGHYWQLGQIVAKGDVLLWSEKIAYRTPGYPWMIGAVLSVYPAATPTTIAILQGFLLTATNFLTGYWVLRITNSYRAALAAMALSLFFLARVSWVCTVLTETLFTFFLVLHLCCCTAWILAQGRGVKSELIFTSISVAASYAGLILVRPIATYLMLVHGIALAIAAIGIRRLKSSRGSNCGQPAVLLKTVWSSMFLQLCIMGLCLLAFLSPWIYRNQVLFDRAMITQFVGRNIWIVTYQDGAGAGLSLPETSESKRLFERLESAADGRPTVDWRRTWQVSEALTKSGLDDCRADQWMQQVAWQSITRQPRTWASKAVRRFVNYYRCVSDDLPVLGNYWTTHSLGWCTGVMLFGILSAVVGLCRAEDRLWTVWFLGIIAYFGAVTALVEIPDYRYRMVIEPVLIVMVILALRALCSRWQQVLR